MAGRHIVYATAFICAVGGCAPVHVFQGDSLERGGEFLYEEAPQPIESLPASPPLPSLLPDDTPLPLSELEQLAEQFNPTIAQAAVLVQAAHGRLIQAGLYPNPTLGYQASEMGNDGHGGQHGAFASQVVLRADKMHWNRAVASSAIARAEFALATQRQRVLNDVRIKYYEALAAQMTLEMLGQLANLAQEAIDFADFRIRAGEANKADLLLSKAAAGQVQVQLATATNEQTAIWRQLAALVGIDELELRELASPAADDLPEFDWESSLVRLQAESPELAAALARIDRARNELALAGANSVPNFTVQAGAQYDDSSNFTFAGLQFSSPIPIYNDNRGNILRARAELLAAEREFGRIMLHLRERLATTMQRWQSAKERFQLLDREVVGNASSALDDLLPNYRDGEATYEKLFNAQQVLYGASLERIAALRELRISAVLLEGYLLQGGLDAPPRDESSD